MLKMRYPVGYVDWCAVKYAVPPVYDVPSVLSELSLHSWSYAFTAGWLRHG